MKMPQSVLPGAAASMKMPQSVLPGAAASMKTPQSVPTGAAASMKTPQSVPTGEVSSVPGRRVAPLLCRCRYGPDTSPGHAVQRIARWRRCLDLGTRRSRRYRGERPHRPGESLARAVRRTDPGDPGRGRPTAARRRLGSGPGEGLPRPYLARETEPQGAAGVAPTPEEVSAVGDRLWA